MNLDKVKNWSDPNILRDFINYYKSICERNTADDFIVEFIRSLFKYVSPFEIIDGQQVVDIFIDETHKNQRSDYVINALKLYEKIPWSLNYRNLETRKEKLLIDVIVFDNQDTYFNLLPIELIERIAEYVIEHRLNST